MLKAGDSICVEMVSAHTESAEMVALLCCCLRYLKIREYRPYPSVSVLVCAPGFARENKKTFFSLRLPCLFDRSIYPPHHPHNDFFSLSRSRDLRWRLNSRSLRHGLTLSGFAFAIACSGASLHHGGSTTQLARVTFSSLLVFFFLILIAYSFSEKERFSLPPLVLLKVQ